MSAYDVGADRLYGHIKKRKGRVEFLQFCRYVRSLYPIEILSRVKESAHVGAFGLVR